VLSRFWRWIKGFIKRLYEKEIIEENHDKINS